MGQGSTKRAELNPNMRNAIYEEHRHLTVSTYRRGPRTHTHTPKINGPRGSPFGPPTEEDSSAGGPEPGWVPSRLVRSHRTSTTTVGLEPSFQNPRAHDPGCSASTTTMSHREGPQTTFADQATARSHRKGIGHDHCSTLVLTTTLLFLPGPWDFFPPTRLLIGRGVVGRPVVSPHWSGRTLHLAKAEPALR